MKKFLVVLSVCFALLDPLFGNQSAQVAVALKPRQPNWRFEVVQAYPQGNPHVILFFEPLLDGTERPVKQVVFFENNRIAAEVDVVVVPEDSELAKKWKSTIVPNGSRLDFSPEGKLLKVANYEMGTLQGECKTFFPDGKVQTTVIYRDDVVNGDAQSYYENGALREKVHYENGKLEGDVLQFHENGAKSAFIPHKDGKVHGTATEWFPNGILKSQRQFVNGQLHGDGKNPAVIVYDEERNVVEIVDFREGLAVGMHTRYHKNGKEAYRLNYKNGKKEGKEQLFKQDGSLLGGGTYKNGLPVGKHWRNHESGEIAYLAQFSEEGQLIEPAQEFNEKGIKIRQFTLVGEALDGPYFEWYADGSLKYEYNYSMGQFEGEQKEYYPSGQIKVFTTYKNEKIDGVHQEWHENGIMARRVHFVDGLKDGQLGEWYPNGISKLDAYFQMDHPDGIQSEWHDNGQLKTRAEFAVGIKQGWQRDWNESGDLMFEAFFDKNELNGTLLSWWSKDQLKMRLHFNNGKKEGKHEWFYENGRAERTASFIDDQMDGKNLVWFRDGSVQSVQEFKNGKPVGEHITFFPKTEAKQQDTDRIAHIFHYDDEGILHGEEKTYFEGGIVQAILNYDHGKPHGVKQMWDKDGVLLEEASYVQGKMEGKFFQKSPEGREVVTFYQNNLKHGPHVVFFPPNQKEEKIKAMEAVFKNDQLDGIVVEYTETGLKLAETPYVQGKKEGKAEIYFPDGKLNTTVIFANDKRNGPMIQYFPKGAIFRENEFVDDQLEGEEKTYFENGILASVCNYHKGKLDGLSQNWNQAGVLVFEAEYLDGLRHGKFNKFYDDGKPYIEQTFVYDLAEGTKIKYEKDGHMTVSNYEAGKSVGDSR